MKPSFPMTVAISDNQRGSIRPLKRHFVRIKKILFLTVVQWLHVCFCFGQVNVTHLLSDHLSDPVGIDDPMPRLSWHIAAGRRGVAQTAYEIKVWEGAKIIWSTGKILSSRSIEVPYAGETLVSGKKYEWRVRIWDDRGLASGWSAPASWRMGLLRPSDWKAQWISVGYTEDSLRRPSPLLRKVFNAGKKVRSAIAYITAHGLYEAKINGRRVGDAWFTPGWTDYDKRLQYQAYDVTQLLQKGDNVVGVTLGDGWYRGVFGQWNYANNYGHDASLLFQLEITYTDGTSATVVSDESWRSSTGAIRYADLYNGEIYDARQEKKGWTSPGYPDKDWANVTIKTFPKDNLAATISQPVKEQEHFHPLKVFTSPRGERIVDFGQNLAGWVRFKVKGKIGDTIRLSHAEVLDKEGNFFTGNLREALAQDVYVLSGTGEASFSPHFTFHGFRFVKVEGYPGDIRPEDFEAVALYSDMPLTGTFTCSNAAINQMQHNITWSQKSNFLDIPSDCPQRSERLGWCGDVQIFSRTAAFNRQVDNFFTRWLGDLVLEQGVDGGMPNVIPNLPGRTLKRAPTGVAGWGDVATVLPWTLYQVYGDAALLRRQYASMKAWVDHVHAVSKNYLWRAGGYGDWLAPDPVVTDIPYISQCWWGYSIQLLINAARALNKMEDVAAYSVLLEKVKQAFLKEYITPGGRAISNTQTAYILALYFDMLPDTMRVGAAERLVELVHNNHDHLSTGFLGTPFLLPVLSRYGYDSLAFTVLLQDTPPSWLYSVKMGATTIWEKWEAVHRDGTPDSTSFNHYSYGAIGDWLYRTLVGLDTYEEAPGYKHSKIQPHTGGGLTAAAGELLTPYGKLSSHWQWDKEDVLLDLEIPANTTATVYIPAKEPADITEANTPIQHIPAIRLTKRERSIQLELASGVYHFRVKQWQGQK